MAGLNSKFSKEPQGRAAYYSLLCAACCEDYRQQIATAQGKKELEKLEREFRSLTKLKTSAELSALTHKRPVQMHCVGLNDV